MRHQEISENTVLRFRAGRGGVWEGFPVHMPGAQGSPVKANGSATSSITAAAGATGAAMNAARSGATPGGGGGGTSGTRGAGAGAGAGAGMADRGPPLLQANTYLSLKLHQVGLMDLSFQP